MKIDLGLRSVRWPCDFSGCRNTHIAILSGADSRERQADVKRQREAGPVFCLRHSKPEQVPTLERRHIEKTLVIVNRGAPWTNGEVWAVPIDNVTANGTSYEHGPGFLFYADELPVNARITFSVDVEIPEPEEL